jgi:hypothetical protein
MPEYVVSWDIDIIADTPEEAALEALKIQRDRASLATVFDVYKPGNKITKLAQVDLQGVDTDIDRTCFECQEGLLESHVIPEYKIGPLHDDLVVVVPNVPVLKCNKCGDMVVPFSSASYVDIEARKQRKANGAK